MAARPQSIKSKLTRLVLITILAVLGVTSTLLLTYEVLTYRHTTAQNLEALADVIAENSAAVIIYDDRRLADEMLNGLRTHQEIVAAALFDEQGRRYASYVGSPDVPALDAIPGPEGVHVGSRTIIVVKAVTQAGARVGTLVFRGNLAGTYQRLLAYALLLVGVVAISATTALSISRLFQRRITEPLLELARAARVISNEKDFSIRARRTSDDELGDLTDAFNTMLDQIVLGNAALRQSEERFRTLADNIAQMAWMADATGTQLWFNRRWQQFMGETGGDRSASAFFGDRHHPEHRERVVGKWRAAVAAGRSWEDTFPLRDRNGAYRWFLSHAVPICDEDGQVVHWFGTATDVTELREVQQQLRESRDQALAASRAKDDFLAQLSHELRTPLNPVLLLVSDTERQRELPPAIRKEFEDIRKHIELEARLIDDLLDLTAITHGKLTLVKRSVDAHEVLRDALTTVRTDIEAKHIRLTVNTVNEPARVMADGTRLQQVFWNVLKNATKFTPHGGRIEVTTCVDPADRHFVAEIRDSGMGMTAEEMRRAFEPFAQGDHTGPRGSRRFGGLGLGLAISRMLMSLHGGSILAASEGRDRGSAITLQLPLARPEEAHDDAGARPFAAMRGTHANGAADRHQVLVVEDHEPTLTALAHLLTRRGYAVVTAGSVAEARLAAARHKINILISDIGLPDGSGHDLMMELGKKADGRLTGIAVTGYGMEEDIARARQSGFAGHLTKPITVSALEDALAKVARAPQVERA